jgi:hypothetical protein
MTETEAVEAIAALFVSAWPTLQPSVPLRLGNEVEDSAATWVRLTVQPLTEEQATMGPVGGRRFEHRGAIVVELFCDLGGGMRARAVLADSVRAVLRGTLVGGQELITFSAAAVPRPTREQRWDEAVMRIPYRFDEQA